MTKQKILFLDRDGTLIEEPPDQQIDSIEKLSFMPNVISALLKLKQAGYKFVMVTNQDGLGSTAFPYDSFSIPHQLMLKTFSSEGIIFDAIHICPHLPENNCDCRKPKIGMLTDYLIQQKMDRENSFVIGDRETDLMLAKNLGIAGIRLGDGTTQNWHEVTQKILNQDRTARIKRQTNETCIDLTVNLDQMDKIDIQTPIGFFNHMLEQLAKHGGFSLSLSVKGDTEIDDHHTVEDTAIALGEGIRQALGNKWGIGRYGFLLPMDETLAQVAIDLSGRFYLLFNGEFKREKVGDLSTELVSHFFRSFAEGLKATLHIEVKGENTHHMIEATFKGVGRALRQAISKTDNSLPTTKGVL